jgi:16S rRNA (adenine1518-N6/adenine1519-N6)-dimethyltransferase
MPEKISFCEEFHQEKKQEKINNPNSVAQIVQERLNSIGIRQNEEIGQHFLIEDKALSQLCKEIDPTAIIIEIGSGVGQLTEQLAQKAFKVISIEIDTRLQPVLNDLQKRYNNLKFIFGDALTINYESIIKQNRHSKDNQVSNDSFQIIANLPFHITEPFIQQFTKFQLPMSLLVGEKFAQATQANARYDRDNYSNLSLFSQSFYEINCIVNVPRQAFTPEPRTEAAIMRFTTKDETRDLSKKGLHYPATLQNNETKFYC